MREQPRVAAPSPTLSRIASWIQVAQPRKGQAYALRVAACLLKEAQHYQLDPLLPTAVAYYESEFDMTAGPDMGIMQINRKTYREIPSWHKLKPFSIEDNIHMGVQYLHDTWRAGARRKGTVARLRYTFCRYNGCGPNAKYPTRVLTIYRRMKNDQPEQWKPRLRTAMLWN